MTLAANAFQSAIYTRLASQLGATPIYDFVPQSSSFPYVVIGADTAIPADTKSNDGQEFTSTIHVWGKGAGRKSVKTLMQSVYAALHHQETAITVTGYSLVLIRCEYSETLQEQGAEGDTDHYYHGVMRFRALVKN